MVEDNVGSVNAEVVSGLDRLRRGHRVQELLGRLGGTDAVPRPSKSLCYALSMSITQELLADILRLPSEDRALIAQEVLASLDADSSSDGETTAAASWRAEIVRRAREVHSGEAVLIDEDVVHADVLAALRVARER